MLKKDETNQVLIYEHSSYYNNYRMSYKKTKPTSKQVMDEFRHGYGISYWIDGAYYEGEWHYNKVEG